MHYMTVANRLLSKLSKVTAQDYNSYSNQYGNHYSNNYALDMYMLLCVDTIINLLEILLSGYRKHINF